MLKCWLKYALAIILVFAFTGASAQIKSTYSGGLHISTMTLKGEDLNSGPGRPFGFHFGYLFEIPVVQNLTFRPGVLFSAKGTDYRLDSIDHTISPIYLEIPLNAALSFGGKKVSISLVAGPYIAFGVGGTIWESGKSVQELKYGKGEGSDLRFFDAGLNFAIGVQVNKFMVSAQYGMGLTNISVNNPDIVEMKNQVIGISFSTAFSSRK